MIYEYLSRYNIDNLGYIVIIDDSPHLFLLKNDDLLKGFPLIDDTGIYDGLQYNDVALVGVNIMNDKKEIVNINNLKEDDMVNLYYNIIIIHIYTLKTMGLKMDDMIDLNLFDILVKHVIQDFENKKSKYF